MKNCAIGQEGSFQLSSDGQDVAVYSYNNILNAYIFNVVSNDRGIAVIQHARNTTVLLTIIIAVMITLIISLILNLFLRKISVLKAYMYRVQDEGMDTLPIQLGKDEIGDLATVFNNAVSAVKALTEMHLDEMDKLHKSEIKLLQHQINWHFIYNTLNAIEMHAIVKGAPDIADAVSSFGNMLRYSAEGEQVTVPLREEIGYIRNFVELLNMQYDNQLEMLVNISSVLLEVQIPRMLLQPIIENSFVHGLLPIKKNGVVTITADSKEGFIYLSVEDNGAGIDSQTLEQINGLILQDSIDSDFAGDHIALCNTSSRIKSHYGRSCGLRIESDGASYTRVILKINPHYNERSAARDV